MNKNIYYLSKRQIYLNYKKMEVSKYGRLSNIYNYNENELLKLFLNNRNYEKKKFNFFCEFNLNNFILPRKLVYIMGFLYGYIMDKKKGVMLENINLDLSLKDFFSNFNKIEKQLYLLSENNIIINDIHNQNMLFNYDNKELFIIDTDEYYMDKTLSKNERTYLNFKTLYSNLFFILLEEDVLEIKESELTNIIETELYNDNYNAEKIFNILIKKIDEINENKITTIKDFRENTKKLIYKNNKKTYN